MHTFHVLLFIKVFLPCLALDPQPPNVDNPPPQNPLVNGPSSVNIPTNNGDTVAELQATNFEIKATLTKCSKPNPCDCDNTFQCASNETQNVNLRTKEDRTKCEQQADDKVLKSCEKKVSLTLKVKNRGPTNCRPQYIILDHVLDTVTDKKEKLLNPYVLKIVQRPVMQVYDLVFENVVNSGPTEKVVNKNNEGYTGCNTDSDDANPTCGSVKYENKEIPYSTGFCCSCLSPRNAISDGDGSGGDSSRPNLNENHNNAMPFSDDQKGISNLMDLPNLSGDVTNLPYLPEHNKIDYGPDGLTDRGGEIKANDPAINPQNVMPGDNFGTAPRIIGRRSSFENTKGRTVPRHVQKRGGQDCDDKYTPPNADPNTYHDSAHCMQFSDVWYSIYKIAHPDIAHSVEIQIFEKIGLKANRVYWREVTSAGPISIGTTDQRYSSSDGTILAYYTVNQEIESEFTLDCKTSKLLIPEVVGGESRPEDHPEACGGPPEYLVANEGDVELSGKTCNKAGVGYEAFARQPNKCESDRNSCLQNQPKQMWQHDHDLEANGKKGCYFLKNHGPLPDNPVQEKPCNGSTKKSQNKLLYMYYFPSVTSTVNINFAADLNVVLRADALASITEVYTETLNPKRVSITAKILNSGLVTSVLYVGIGACPLQIPASFGSITSQPVLIAPQHQHCFTLEIYCELPIRNFFCSLEVFNMRQQLVAVRRIRFQIFDRCVCVWYCQCSCFRTDSDDGLKCRPLEIELYHAAGFQAGMPIATQVVNYSDFDDTISIMLHIVLFFCLTLWYMGLIKASIGCCLLPIGLWGLDKILDLPKKLNRYYETELKDQEVVYNDEGWAVHPETGKKVNNMAPTTQFSINMVFFFVLPFAIIWNLCKKLLAPKYSAEQMFSDLDICRCRASQISLMRDYSLQNSAAKKSGSTKQLRENPSKGGVSSSQTGSRGGEKQVDTKKKKKSSGGLSSRSKSD